MHTKYLSALLALAVLVLVATVPPPQASPELSVINLNGNSVSSLTDGDSVRLQLKLAGAVDQPTSVSFTLVPDDIPVGECTVAKSANTCRTEVTPTLGWFWDKARQPQSRRTIRAGSAALQISVAPRPVVMAHGFGSSPAAWTAYLGDKGFLGSIGLRGFAVGDGQAPGRLLLGDLANPTGRTGTIQSNAATLGEYISAVKKLTGAQMVDLIAHSMGNLVSRYYIDRVMAGRDIAQMIMLGPPNQGTDCAMLPASLGYYLPAALEIRPGYVRGIFNPQITKRHGVPFSIIAGTPIVEPIASPCTPVPTDLAIALDSAGGIAAPLKQTGIWHGDLNTSPRVFDEFIKPLLQRTAGEFPNEPDPVPPAPAEQDLQFTRVFTGHLASKSSETQTINIDNVTVASFALFDPTRSLTVTVRGATGNVVVLDPTRNGLFVVEDPETLVYLGYGFNNPRPGPWQVTLQATERTPSAGADYAISAKLQGGAVLKVQASDLLPPADALVQLSAIMELGGQSIAIREASAQVRMPGGSTTEMPLTPSGNVWQTSWRPALPGIYGIAVNVSGSAPDGTLIERSAALSVEAQPPPEQFQPIQVALLGGAGLAGILVVSLVIMRFRRRK